MSLGFSNLLSNAIKYSADDKTIEVRIDKVRRDDTEWAIVCVVDYGIGIDPEDLPHVFDLFWRAESVGSISGSGVGLASARRIIEQHGGTLRAESSRNQGSVFTVSLPLVLPHAT